MRDTEAMGLKRWAWRYIRYPEKYPPSNKIQRLAVEIDCLLNNGQWHTIRAITALLNAKSYQVRDALFCVSNEWNYEAIRSVHRGYRKKI
jgi:hypothetical protein